MEIKRGKEAGAPIGNNRQNQNTGIPKIAVYSPITASDTNSATFAPKCDQSEGKHTWMWRDLLARLWAEVVPVRVLADDPGDRPV